MTLLEMGRNRRRTCSRAPKPAVQVRGVFVDRAAEEYGARPSPLAGQPLSDWLAAPLEQLVASFEAPTPIGLSLLVDTEPDGLISVDLSLKPGGGWMFGVRPDQPVANLIAQTADGIQEHLPEESQTWGQPRPPCPGHGHPAVVRVVDRRACWVCPEQAATLTTITEQSWPLMGCRGCCRRREALVRTRASSNGKRSSEQWPAGCVSAPSQAHSGIRSGSRHTNSTVLPSGS